jgi:hypothetical protein
MWAAAAWLAAQGLAGTAAAQAQGADGAWDPRPWVEDLAQIRDALETQYANYDWLRDERELDLAARFPQLEERLRGAGSDAAARALLDRMIERIGDGHVALRWPRPARPAGAAGGSPGAGGLAGRTPGVCRALGYESGRDSPGIAAGLPGYAALAGTNAFAAGTAPTPAGRLGILRIPIFQPQGYPAVCEAAVAALALPADKPCDDSCADAVLTWAYARMTRDIEERLRQLKAAGADVLMVDVSENGGGSEWAEAAARMLTPRRLRSEALGFVRGPHWAKQWRELADRLHDWAAEAPADRARLLGWAAEAETAARQAESPCPATGACDRIGRAGYATGLVGEARSGAFAGKPWAPYVFSPAQYRYHDGVWTGPLILLVDEETWSAAEQFAAVLQDNRAALVLGARTGGAGCGHTAGGTPTVLRHSGATLEVPDCVRFRRDGSNEVRGILPDRLVAMRFRDGGRLKARLVAEALPAAMAEAKALRAGSARGGSKRSD